MASVNAKISLETTMNWSDEKSPTYTTTEEYQQVVPVTPYHIANTNLICATKK